MVLPSLQSSVAFLKKVRRASDKGFSLIEMLVVIGIIVVITSVILVNNNRFGGVIQLQNLAYDIALTVRQAQVYGISVQRFGNNTFAPAYGMHFDMTSPNNYVLFGDVNVPYNGVYDPGGVVPELVQSMTIQSGYGIYSLHATIGGVEATTTSLDVTYRRPDPEAFITKQGTPLTFLPNGKLSSGSNPIYEQGRIVVRSPRGDLKSIVISLNGQISVQ